VAQDFHAAFGLGDNDKAIGTVDEAGVALAAIQGLNQKVEDGSRRSEARTQELEAKNAALEKEVAELKALVQELANKVNRGAQ
jgi:DNA-binding transcriptional MerR regulator